MENQADYSQYRCPFDHVEKECGHELNGPEGYGDADGRPACRIWCPCGFRGPAFYLDPGELGLRKKDLLTAMEAEVEKLYKDVE